MESNPAGEIPEWIKNIEPLGSMHIDTRDYFRMLISDLNFDAQLFAIRDVLSRQEQADKVLSSKIDELGETAKILKGLRNEMAVDEWVDLVQSSVYQDAAHSMSAVGMLAPFMETIFQRAFLGMYSEFFSKSIPHSGHDRWVVGYKQLWDCHNVVRPGRVQTDVAGGILQMADAVGLKDRLPADLKQTLEALFSYRNKMFHFGFEWPLEERQAFKKRIDDSQWPAKWFTMATHGGEPWIYYLSQEFIDHCFTTIGNIMDVFGAFVRDELVPKINAG